MQALGFHVDVQSKENDSPILSAFMKSNTKKLLLAFEEPNKPKSIHPEEKISIKLEIDTNPPMGFEVESKLVLKPTPFHVLTYHPKDLFAGKMHALLCRNWKNRIKGRDWYDFIWYINKNIPVHLSHLTIRMQQSGHLQLGDNLNHSKLLLLLQKKIKKIDFNQAKNDVKPFLNDPKVLDVWSASFFTELIQHLKSE